MCKTRYPREINLGEKTKIVNMDSYMTFTGQWKIIIYGQIISSPHAVMFNKCCRDPHGLLFMKI